MDYLKAYWVAFGGSATALIIIGSLFTWLIQYRFNKNLEAFKKGLQEELARTNYLYLETAKSAKEVYAMASKINSQYYELREDAILVNEGKLCEHYEKYIDAQSSFMTSVDALSDYVSDQLNLDSLSELALREYCLYVHTTFNIPVDDSTKVEAELKEADTKLNTIRQQLKTLIGAK